MRTGRFAPSPNGDLHFGSLVTALASFLNVRAQGGRWIVRIDDIDPPRVKAQAESHILRSLEHVGLHWDAVVHQSSRQRDYLDALAQLSGRGLTYRCDCSRKTLKALGHITIDEAYHYAGSCRAADRSEGATRLRTDDTTVVIEDPIQGRLTFNIAGDFGDFILRRADDIMGYHLASVVDDMLDGTTEVIRGADLLYCAPRQKYLQQLLGAPTLWFAHVPLAIDASGEKFAKSRLSPAMIHEQTVPLLVDALQFLGQAPPDELMTASRDSIVEWAVEHWRLDRVPKVRDQRRTIRYHDDL